MDIIAKKRTHTHTEEIFQCPSCRNGFRRENEARHCLARHGGSIIHELGPGDSVFIDDGDYGGEQGQMGMSWWPKMSWLAVVRNISEDNKFLVERPDGTRRFVGYSSVLKAMKQS